MQGLSAAGDGHRYADQRSSMNLIRVFNLCGGFLFGTGLLGGIDAITRQQQNMLNSTIISQSKKGGDAKSFIELAANERGLINFITI